MEYYINYNPIADNATLAIIVMFFIIFKFTFYSYDKRNIWLRIGLITLFGATLFNIAYMTIFKYCSVDYKYLVYIFRDIADILLLVCLNVYCKYLAFMFRNNNEIKIDHLKHINNIVLIVCSIFTIISPLTHFGFYFVDNTVVSGSFFLDPFTIGYIYYIAIMLHQLIRYRKYILTKAFIALILTFIFVEAIMIGEAATNSSSFVCFTFVLPLIITFALFHSNSYDVNTGTLNQSAFDEYLNDLKNIGVSYGMVSLTFVGEKDIDEFLSKIKLELTHFYEKFFNNSYTFRISERRFILIYESLKEKDIEKAKKYFVDEFTKIYDTYQMDFKLLATNTNRILKNHNEYARFISFIEKNNDKNSFYEIKETDYDLYDEYLNILKNLENIVDLKNMNDKRILTYVQPIYNVKTKKLTSGESLMRLKLDDKIISPAVFIPIAESYNLIHQLSLIMLNNVCKNIKELDKTGHSIERISVNFSTNEFLNDNIYDEIKNIIDKYKLPYNKIGIEITESVDTCDFDKIVSNISKLKNLGIKIYLDDYGTGYSNIERVMKLPLDIVKFDKSLLDTAKKDKKLKSVTFNSVNNFRNLKMGILFEGVETDKDIDFCIKEMNADYLQGYVYSKPVPIEELKNMIN